MSFEELKPSSRHAVLEQAVADAFLKEGWQLDRQPNVEGHRPNLIARRGHRQYAIELKASAEARRDRVIPLLAQGILEARASASSLRPNAQPLAVIGAPNLSDSVIKDLQSFAARVAPDVAIGIVDFEGPRIFIGRDLEALSRDAPRRHSAHPIPRLKPRLHLFSDLNQWMLKVLLAPQIPANLLHASRQKMRSASDLAKAANVSVMSAFRCLELLRADGFLDESGGLRLVNLEALFDRWRSANRKPVPDVPMRWIIPGDPESQLKDALRAYSNRQQSLRSLAPSRDADALPPARLCLGLFAAAAALGFKFVRGVAPHIYLDRLDPFIFESLGLAPAREGQRADLLVRVPPFRESVFRAAVMREGLAVSDVIQVWLDVVDHPSRGSNQAEQIWRRVLLPLWRRDSV